MEVDNKVTSINEPRSLVNWMGHFLTFGLDASKAGMPESVKRTSPNSDYTLSFCDDAADDE